MPVPATSVPARVAFHTLGCKLNFSESSTLARSLREDGFEVVDFREDADVYVINTCSVTGTAEKKCRQAIQQAHRRNPLAKIAVIGCFSQLKPLAFSDMEGVEIILGSNTKFDLPALLRQEKASVPPPGALGNDRFIPAFSSNDRTRSFVKVQDGCDYYCAYCTIPYARGHSRSGRISQVLETVSEALQQGSREIVLTGINLGDFGKQSGEKLEELLLALDGIKHLERLRLSSIEPDLLSDAIIDLVASSPRLMPHFHIPLQSGSDKILKRMKRKYDSRLFAGRVERIKKNMPFACIAADVICGFPGESGEDFDETYQLLHDLSLSYFHVFPFSARPGTLAATLEEKVNKEDIVTRSKRLQALSNTKKHAFYTSNAGREARVLFESEKKNNFLHGFTENYLLVKTPFQASLVNQITALRLDHYAQAKGAFFHQAD